MIDNETIRALILKNQSENKPSTTESIVYDLLYYLMHQDKDKIGSLKIYFSCYENTKEYLNNIVKETYKLEDLIFKIHYAEYEQPGCWRLDGSQLNAPRSFCYSIQPERSKREDSQRCEMRCSEHCGNTVKEVQ